MNRKCNPRTVSYQLDLPDESEVDDEINDFVEEVQLEVLMSLIDNEQTTITINDEKFEFIVMPEGWDKDL